VSLQWELLWPVYGVSIDDALLFCRWKSVTDEVFISLPNEVLWEKAAVGLMGGIPMGKTFDPALGNMARSHENGAYPVSVEEFRSTSHRMEYVGWAETPGISASQPLRTRPSASPF